jgi:mannan endo-1,4-beta-mannosidase
MNRAALAARMFLVVALLPAIGAAGYAAYEYRTQPPIPVGTYHQFPSEPLINGRPTPGLLLGTYAPGADVTGLAKFDHAITARAALTVRYMAWGKPFPATYVAHAAGLRAETVLELEPRGPKDPSLAAIAAGVGDRWLRKFAAEMLALPDHIILSFAPEMNGAWYKYGHGHVPPSDYVRAFRHVHDVLAATRAAKLITYLWQPSAVHLTTPPPEPYWPGAKYVDEIGLDGYYFFPSDTFRVIFGQTLRMLRALAPKTPILIGETAIGPKSEHEGADIKDLFAGIRRNHLIGLIWFDKRQKVNIYHQDWRLQDNHAALADFAAALESTGPLGAFLRPKHN